MGFKVEVAVRALGEGYLGPDEGDGYFIFT